MVATIYGSSQAQLSERLGNVMRCDARFTADTKKPRYCEARLLQALLPDVVLQIANLFGHCFDSLSEGEIIPLSGVCKSGGGSIAHAAGAGRPVRCAGCVELQPTLASSNIALKLIDSALSICKLLCVLGVERCDITLASLHIGDSVFSQI